MLKTVYYDFPLDALPSELDPRELLLSLTIPHPGCEKESPAGHRLRTGPGTGDRHFVGLLRRFYRSDLAGTISGALRDVRDRLFRLRIKESGNRLNE